MTTTATIDRPIVEDISPPYLPDGMDLEDLRSVSGGFWFRESSPVREDFIRHWRQHETAFLRRGFSLISQDGTTRLAQWLNQDGQRFILTHSGFDALKRHLSSIVGTADQLPAKNDHPPTPAQPLSRIPAAAEKPEPPAIDVADLPPLPNGLEEKLRKHQVQAARQLYRALSNGRAEWQYSGAWDTSFLGSGKTYTSLAAAIATGLEVGIVCPVSVIGTAPTLYREGSGWLRAFAHFKQQPRFVLNYESLRTGKHKDILTLKVEKKGNREVKRFAWQLSAEDTILIWDEAHYVRNPSLNREMARAALRQGIPCLFVSGTMAESPMHMAATGVAVGLHNGTRSDYERFLREFGCIQQGPLKWEFPSGRSASKHLSRLHHIVFPARGARIREEDIEDFPETTILCEPYFTDDAKAIQAAFKAAQQEINERAKSGELSGAMLEIAKRGTYMAAWHESERLKIPAIVRMAQDEIANGRSVAIFANFTDTRLELMRQLRTNCAVFGQQSKQHRDACLADFQSNRVRVIVVNIKAGGAGVDLHDVTGDYPRTAIILPTNQAVAVNQALGRVHRVGGKSHSRQIVFFAAETVEEDICESVRRKIQNMETLNDGTLTPPPIF